MNFNNILPEWKNTGTEPSDTLKNNGFNAGYKPPANIFNWFWNKVIAAITELQTKLSNVDNTSDLNKPISTAVQTALDGKANTSDLPNITKNPDNTTGDIISTHLTVGTRGGEYSDGSYSFTVGFGHEASGDYSSVLSGKNNLALANYSSILAGQYNMTHGMNSSVLGGYSNSAFANQTKCGHYAKDGTAGTESGTTGDAFIIGNGTSSATSNCFRVGYDGYVYGGKTFAANSADNAHFYEWLDGNPNNEDRRGLFVTLDGTKIRLATPEDTYIKGVVSAQPSFVSNAYSDNWQGMYLKDIFGAYLTDENGNYIINPDYDATKEYIPRENRPEWDWVTNDGDIVLVDDGTCEVNGFATVGAGGKATKADTKTDYRVMERKDDTHIYVSVR